MCPTPIGRSTTVRRASITKWLGEAATVAYDAPSSSTDNGRGIYSWLWSEEGGEEPPSHILGDAYGSSSSCRNISSEAPPRSRLKVEAGAVSSSSGQPLQPVLPQASSSTTVFCIHSDDDPACNEAAAHHVQNGRTSRNTFLEPLRGVIQTKRRDAPPASCRVLHPQPV